MVVASGAGRSAVLLLVISEILTWTLALAPPASAADVVVVSGSAFGEQVDTLDGLITSGPLPSVTVPESDGTASSDSARSACVPAGVCSILRTGPLRAAAQGSRSENGRVEGSASDARVDVSGIVTADLVWSRCASRDGGLSGASAITNVTVGGQLLGSDPRPNTVIELPGVARVILNEQITAPDSITVNAIHVQLLSGTEGDVILPQAHCAATHSLVPAMPESPLVVLVPALTMAALMSVVVLAWRRDPLVISRLRR